MLKIFDKKIRQAWIRCSLNLLLEQFCIVLLFAAIAAALAVLTERLLAVKLITDETGSNLSIQGTWVVWGFFAAISALAVIIWLIKHPSRMDVALQIDERLKLHERFSATLAFEQETFKDDPFAKAARAESLAVANKVKIHEHFPVKLTGKWRNTLGSWLIVLALVLFMPQKDLLGFLQTKQKEQQKKVAVEKNRNEIKKATTAVKMMVDKLGDPSLQDAIASLNQIPAGAKPQTAKRQVIRKLGDLTDQIKKMQSNPAAEAVRAMQKMLKQIRSTPNAFSQQLNNAMAQGNFAKAASILNQMQQQLQKNEMSDQQRQNLQKQLQSLSKQLQELAKKNDQFEKELQKMGLDKKLAKQNNQQLRKTLQKMGLNQNKIEQLLKKAAACRSAAGMCSKMGQAMAGAGAGGMTGDELSDIMDQLSELDALKQQIELTEASLEEIKRCMGCMGEGMCIGPGKQGPWAAGESNKWGSGTGGPGKGFGPRNTAETGNYSTVNTKVKGKTGTGPNIASWYIKGSQIKGQAQRDYSKAVQAGRDAAAEAISENQIPRRYEDPVKKYFGNLDNSNNDRSDISSEPAEKADNAEEI